MSDDADDRVVPLSRFSAVLGRARGSRRLDAILSASDPARVVAELSVLDLYYLVKEVGVADAGELVGLATTEQVQGFLDLDGWAQGELRPAELRPWLEALVAAGPEQLTRVWRALDPELTALLLARATRIYTLGEEEVPEDEEPPFFPTP